MKGTSNKSEMLANEYEGNVNTIMMELTFVKCNELCEYEAYFEIVLMYDRYRFDNMKYVCN